MADILNKTFTAIDGKEHHIVVSQHLGASNIYYVYIDKYFVGQIVPSLQGMIPHLNTDLLTSDDIGAIMDAVNGV